MKKTADDTDYVTSSSYPASDVLEVKLGPLTDPATSLGHVVNCRYLKPQGFSSNQIDLTVELRQGAGTSIASWTYTNIGPITQVSQALTDTQADSITDYTDLRIRFTANCPT